MEVEQIPEEHCHKKGRHRKKQLYNSILQQMEFYFSDSNITKDRFLSQLIESDPNIELSVFLKFNKLRKLTTNMDDIVKAISKSQLIQLSEDKTRVFRKLPIKINKDVDDCTIYVERLKSDATHDWLKSIFSEFGNVVYVSIPKYKHNGMIKGFAFVEFETPEGAKAALQYFESIDCKIPSDLEPQKLCSIATFNPNDEKNILKKEYNVREQSEISQEIHKNDEGIEMKDSKSETKENKESSEVEVEIEHEVLPQKKRKLSETVTEEESGGEKKKLKIGDVPEINETILQPEAVSDGEGEEKKKKKHKKSNRKKMNLKELGIQILCKKDWKKMRNRYLEMQRKTMKQLKMHLNRQRFSNRYGNKKPPVEDTNSKIVTENPKQESQFIPGTVVKVSLLEPCENNKKLKTELKDISKEIKYVDIPWKVGSEEVYVRFSDNANAQAFCASNYNKGKCSILEGNEDKMYWEKIEGSRQEKQKKLVGKQRGRDKLLKKAEKQAAKHVRFDDSE